MSDPQPLSLGVKISYALPRLACSLFSQHIGGKARKYYTGAPPCHPQSRWSARCTPPQSLTVLPWAGLASHRTHPRHAAATRRHRSARDAARD